jgi:signal transduction histidine kinase
MQDPVVQQLIKNRSSVRLEKRVETGFILRHAELQSIVNGDQSLKDKDIGFEAADRDQIDLRSFSSRFLSSSLTLSEYIEHLQPLLPIQYSDSLLAYYFSGEYVSNPTALIHSPFYNDAQLSVILQTLYLNGHVHNRELANRIEWGLSGITKILFQRSLRIEDFEGLLTRLGGVVSGPITSTSNFVACLADAKQKLVHSLGPDIFTLFSQVCDPKYSFSEGATSRALSICERWQCVDLFTRLMLIRASRNTADDAAPLNFVISARPGPELLNETINIYCAWDSNSRCQLSVSTRSPGPAAAQVCSVRAAIVSQSAEHLVDELLALYELDPQMLEWVDWDAVYQALKNGRKQEGLRIAAIHLIMGQPIVALKFPQVNMAIGDGAFGSSLRTAVSKFGNRSPVALAEEILKLPSRCRELVVRAVLDQDTAATLAILFGYDPPWAKKLVQTTSLTHDVRASALRSDLANTFAKHGLLNEPRALDIVEEERSRLRVAYLQGRQLQGLVHVNWESLADKLNSEFAGQISLVRRVLLVPELENPEFYLNNVVTAIAELISRFIITDGPEDINTTVSDSLRHGQLPNRFLRAFDEAITHAVAGPLDASALIDELQAATVTHPHWLLYLRNLLAIEIRCFNDEHLAVTPPSEFYTDALDITIEQIRTLIENKIDGQVADCLLGTKLHLENFLAGARNQLRGRIMNYLVASDGVNRAVRMEKVDLSPNYGPPLDKSSFLNALRDKMEEALLDASRWMALATSQDAPEAFHLSDVVELCLLNHRSGDSQDISVKTEVSDRRPGHGIVMLSRPPLINGRYFELAENIVRNIVENAFKHSGLGVHSRVTIEFIHTPNWLTIISRNAISPTKYAHLKATIGQLTAQANRVTLAGAGEDQGSGLQKVRWACNRWLDSIPEIRLQVLTRATIARARTRYAAIQRSAAHSFSFEIQIDVRHRHGSLFS